MEVGCYRTQMNEIHSYFFHLVLTSIVKGKLCINIITTYFSLSTDMGDFFCLYYQSIRYFTKYTVISKIKI